MEEKIEVREYVRTKDGFICRIENLDYIDKRDIVKHSKQLIDLIEVGDFVNGYSVTDKYLFAGEMPVLETEGNDTNCKCLNEKDIKTILTKEQMEANCYKVGGEDE